jgi:hypothetical protein
MARLLMVGVLLGGMYYIYQMKHKPVAAVEFLKKEPVPGNMYNEYEFGDYVIYSAYPQYRVFVAGINMYGVERMKDYYRVHRLGTNGQLLEHYNINFIF